MQCKKIKLSLPDLLLEPAQVPADVQQHLKECSQCENELKQLRATVKLLDAWDAPEPSTYFDTRLAVRLREAKESAAPGFLERMRMRLLFGRDLHLRPVAVAVFALLLAIGGGSYLGVVNLNHAAPQKQQAVSATVNDLELLDSNAQTLQQLAALDDTSAGGNSISN